MFDVLPPPLSELSQTSPLERELAPNGASVHPNRIQIRRGGRESEDLSAFTEVALSERGPNFVCDQTPLAAVAGYRRRVGESRIRLQTRVEGGQAPRTFGSGSWAICPHSRRSSSSPQ